MTHTQSSKKKKEKKNNLKILQIRNVIVNIKWKIETEENSSNNNKKIIFMNGAKKKKTIQKFTIHLKIAITENKIHNNNNKETNSTSNSNQGYIELFCSIIFLIRLSYLFVGKNKIIYYYISVHEFIQSNYNFGVPFNFSSIFFF